MRDLLPQDSRGWGSCVGWRAPPTRTLEKGCCPQLHRQAQAQFHVGGSTAHSGLRSLIKDPCAKPLRVTQQKINIKEHLKSSIH